MLTKSPTEVLREIAGVTNETAASIDQLDHPVKKDFAIVQLKNTAISGFKFCRTVYNEEITTLRRKERKEKIEAVGRKVHAVSGAIFVTLGKGIGATAKVVKTIAESPAKDISKGFNEAYSK